MNPSELTEAAAAKALVDFEPCRTSRWGRALNDFCSECGYPFLAHDMDNICRLPRGPK